MILLLRALTRESRRDDGDESHEQNETEAFNDEGDARTKGWRDDASIDAAIALRS